MDEPIDQRQKDRNPREGANVFSVLTFFYTFKAFFQGYRNGITERDIYETFSEHKSATLGTRAICLWEKIKNPRRSSLVRILVILFARDFLLIGGALTIEIFILQPSKALLLGELISYYSGEESSHGQPVYSLGLIISAFFTCVLTQPYLMGSFHLGLKIKVVCTCLIYNKILKLSKSALNQITPGHIINLISADVNYFEQLGFSFHSIWMAPFQIVLLCYLIWREIGFCSLIAVGFLSVFTIIYVQLRNVLARYRSKVSIRRDERIRLTNELIQGIGVIKMYAWEEAFSKLISQFRKLEVNAIRKFTCCKGLFSFAQICAAVAVCIALTASATYNGEIGARATFVTITLLYSLSTTLGNFIPTGITVLAQATVALERITSFLLCEDVSLDVHLEKNENAVVIRDGSAKWNKESIKGSLSNLNLEIKANSLTAIIGNVGSGKSTLCQVIQKEMPLSQGKITVNGSLSYASQEPWIFSASVRQNILFGCEMVETRYRNVVQCCALQTDFKQLPHGDKTIVGERGASLSGGQKARISLARCLYRDADIYLLDDPLSAVDTRVGRHIFENCIQEFLDKKTVILITHQIQYLPYVDYIIALNNGAVQFQGSESEMNKSNFDYSKFLNQNHRELDSVDQNGALEAPKKVDENINFGFISFSTYKKYLFASKNYALVFFTFLIPLVTEAATSGSLYFVRHWINVEQDQDVLNRSVYIYVYCIIIFAAVIFAVLRLGLLTNLAMKSSKSLHNTMLANLLRASLSFYHANPSGRILNRFTKDLLSIDETLPNVGLIALVATLNVVGLLAVICVVNAWFLIPTFVLLLTVYYVRRFYLTTNLSILRVESVARSPLYNYVQSTLQGLSTIRTFQVQDKLVREFNEHLDNHSAAVYMSYSVSRAFGYWIDVLSFVYFVVTILFYTFTSESYGGNVGMVLSQALRMILIFQYGIRQFTEIENCMVSVERILEYCDIEKERELPFRPPPLWPSEGGIQFKNVSLMYLKKGPFALNDLNVTIKPLEKVGIVGRTGAGKSSIIAALFQLAKTQGSIIIDGIDITRINLYDLRKRISIIPQDPVLFSGTIRTNLDPFDEFDDEILWKALEDVQLKNIDGHLPSDLSSLVSHDGSNLSVGQRQLICLARAIVRQNKILILDEATANVDMKTDEIIQKTIKTKFANCTVLTVAHRINTVIDSDKILVMDAGKLVEFDDPKVLLRKSDGFFSKMVQHTDLQLTAQKEQLQP